MKAASILFFTRVLKQVKNMSELIDGMIPKEGGKKKAKETKKESKLEVSLLLLHLNDQKLCDELALVVEEEKRERRISFHVASSKSELVKLQSKKERKKEEVSNLLKVVQTDSLHINTEINDVRNKKKKRMNKQVIFSFFSATYSSWMKCSVKC